MHKYLIILTTFLLLGCQKIKCDKFYFSDVILENLPKEGSRYNVGSDENLSIELIEVIIDSEEYAITTPFVYQECESVIVMTYLIDNNYQMSLRVSKKGEESNLFCSIAGINLSKHIEFTDENDFLRSSYQVQRLNKMNDTIMSIKMKGLKIEEISKQVVFHN